MWTSLVFLGAWACVSAVQRLPIAPYNIKLYCRNGRAQTIRSMKPTLCPTSSTTCGYFEFAAPERTLARNETAIYECVDSSILFNENEDYDDQATDTFADFCDHRPRCTVIELDDLNKQFLGYLVRSHGLQLEQLRSRQIRFCCTLSHSKLDRLVRSGKNHLGYSSSLPPVTCGATECDTGAIGCFLHETAVKTGKAETPSYSEGEWDSPEMYDEIKPVQLTWDESDLLVDINAANLRAFEASTHHHFVPVTPTPNYLQFGSKGGDNDYDDGYQCVYMHLNDEIYRYCMLIYSQKSGQRCLDLSGYRVCCCFVSPVEATCDPLRPLNTPAPSPSAAASTTTTSAVQVPTTPQASPTFTALERIVVTRAPEATTVRGETTTMRGQQRTRCRTVVMTESRSHGKHWGKARTSKRIICDDVRSATGTPVSGGAACTLCVLRVFIVWLTVGQLWQ